MTFNFYVLDTRTNEVIAGFKHACDAADFVLYVLKNCHEVMSHQDLMDRMQGE